MADCKCGCGQAVKSGRKFINLEHQMEWMLAGGASQLNALQSVEGKQAGE